MTPELPAIEKKRSVGSRLRRYAIAVVSVAVSFSIVQTLERLGMREPRVSILLAAIAVSVWYCGPGPGIVAIALSALTLHLSIHPHGPWDVIGAYDLPYLTVFLVFGLLFHQFSRSRRKAEQQVIEAQSLLEEQIRSRTAELTWLNTEYRTILDAVPFGIVLFGPDRIVRSCSLAYERMLGLFPGEIIGQRAPLPESEEREWRRREEAMRQGKKPFEYDALRIRKDGSTFPATISAVPLFNDDGSYAGLVGSIVDNTERKRAEEELQIFRSVVHNSPDFIGVANMNLDVLFINPAGQRIFGLEDVEVKRIHTLDLFPEEERKRVRDELIPQLIAAGSLRIEVPARNLKTDRPFPALWTSFVIRDPRTGQAALLAAVTRDISSRKRDEDELRRQTAYLKEAQSISHTGSWSWNVTNGLGEWSREFFQILGLDPEVVTPSDSNYLDCLVPEDREGAQRAWSEAVEGMLGFEHEHRIVRPNGAIRHVRLGGRQFQSGSGDLEFIGTLIDTTDQWNARFELESALAANTTLLAEVRALEQQASRENISLKEQNLLLKREFNRDTMFKEIIGSSSALEATLARISRVATTDSTVLITGETGTGKELIAQAIHQASPRADKPFISFNCAAFVPSLIGSELFGHEKGAFTGAEQRRIGRFELAEGGTLFLDEVGDIPAEIQIMLLRVLQEREFERVGGNCPIRSDVRVLAATNRDLKAAIQENRFRSDLFYRLSVFPIEVPPLRDRKEDIPTLVSYFVQKYSRKLDKKILEIDKLTMARLQMYNWPGNIRELQNLIERSVIVSDGSVLVVDDGMLTGGDQRSRYGKYEEEMDNHERRIIEDALEKTRGRVAGPSGAAAILGIPQSTLATRIAVLKIDKHKFSSD